MAETPATEAERRRRAQVWLERCLPDLDRRARARLARHDAEAFAARVDFVLVDLYHAIDVVYGLTHPTDELVERFVNMALDAAVRCPDDLRALDHRREVDQGWFQRAVADAQYGMGGLIAVAVWSDLGDCRRFSRSEQAVRHTGLDVSVDASDRRRAGGFLSRQGPQTLRWALYEAAKNSSHLRSPDHDFYAAVKARHDGKIAAISVATEVVAPSRKGVPSASPASA